jgi:hypothetical protein
MEIPNKLGVPLPRKYRPPAARRRKNKKQAPYYVEPLPQSPGAATTTDGAEAVLTDEAEEEDVLLEEETQPVQTRQRERATATPVKHMTKDYSYVRSEIKRIALVAGILIVALIITAILRG